MSSKEVTTPEPRATDEVVSDTETTLNSPDNPAEQIDLYNFVSTIKNKGPRETSTTKALNGMIRDEAGRQTLSTLIEFMKPKKK